MLRLPVAKFLEYWLFIIAKN